MSGELLVKEDTSGGRAKITVEGEIDIYTSGEFKEKLYRLVESARQDVWIGCSGLNYIDSTGLGIFVGALKKTRQYGGNIHISGLRDNIKKLFIITGLDKLFVMED